MIISWRGVSQMKAAFRQFIRDTFRKHGYLVAKYPSIAFQPVPVFDLAIQLLMMTRGTACTFVEVGANNGNYGDPLCRYVLEFPWRGILIEPQPDVFASLQSNYASAEERLIFENVAISKDARELILYRARPGATLDDVYASSVVSTNPVLVAAQLKISPNRLESFAVPCLTLDALLAKHGWTTFDLLLLDTEGNEAEVLESLDLKVFRPLIIRFEHGHLTPVKLDRAIGYLLANGYRIVYGGYQFDSIALHENFHGLVNGALAKSRLPSSKNQIRHTAGSGPSSSAGSLQ